MSEQSKKDKIEPKKLHSDQELLEIFLKHQIENTKYGGKPMYHYNFNLNKQEITFSLGGCSSQKPKKRNKLCR